MPIQCYRLQHSKWYCCDALFRRMVWHQLKLFVVTAAYVNSNCAEGENVSRHCQNQKQMKNNWGCVCVCARANVSQAICYLLFHEIHLKMRNRSDFIWYSITGWVCGENVSLIWFNLSINWPFCQCTQRCKVITSNKICGQQNFRCAWTNLSPKYLDEY